MSSEQSELSHQQSESKGLSVDTDPINVLAAAIEKVVDKKFHNLEDMILRLEAQMAAVSTLQAKSASSDSKEKSDKGDKGDKGEKGEKSEKDKSKDKEKEGGDKKDKDKKKKEKLPQKEVSVAYKINCVSDISEVSCTFVIDMKVFYGWKDEKLVGRKNGSNVNYEEEKGLFDPDMVVTNEHELNQESSVTKIVDSATGEVKRTCVYKGTVFLLSMNLKSFPFDCQNLQICLKPYKLPIESVVLVAKPPTECAMDHPVIHEWDVLGHCIKSFTTDASTSSTGKVYSTLFVTILTRRKYGWFVANVFIPTAAFLLISWLTFAYGPENRGERNDVSMATLLASIANKYVVCDQIPKVDYRTLLDRYVDLCFALQVLTMLASAIVYDYHSAPFGGAHLNTIFFLIELLLAALFHEWMYVRLSNHERDVEEWVQSSHQTNALHSGDDDAHAVAVTEQAKEYKRKQSVLTKYLMIVWNQAREQLDDGFHDPNSCEDMEHFGSFGAAIVSGLINKEKKKTIENSIKLEEQREAAHVLLASTARSKLRTAILTQDSEKIMQAAVQMIQSSWRARQAKSLLKNLRVEKDQLVLESAAKKIQRIFRTRKLQRERLLSKAMLSPGVRMSGASSPATALHIH